MEAMLAIADFSDRSGLFLQRMLDPNVEAWTWCLLVIQDGDNMSLSTSWPCLHLSKGWTYMCFSCQRLAAEQASRLHAAQAICKCARASRGFIMIMMNWLVI